MIGLLLLVIEKQLTEVHGIHLERHSAVNTTSYTAILTCSNSTSLGPNHQCTYTRATQSELLSHATNAELALPELRIKYFQGFSTASTHENNSYSAPLLQKYVRLTVFQTASDDPTEELITSQSAPLPTRQKNLHYSLHKKSRREPKLLKGNLKHLLLGN